MTTNARTIPAQVPTLHPEDYRDTCGHCIVLYEDRDRFLATPVRLKPTRGGVVARYHHTCGHTWICGWTNKHP